MSSTASLIRASSRRKRQRGVTRGNAGNRSRRIAVHEAWVHSVRPPRSKADSGRCWQGNGAEHMSIEEGSERGIPPHLESLGTAGAAPFPPTDGALKDYGPLADTPEPSTEPTQS